MMQIAGLESLHDEFFLNGSIETRKIREAGMKFIEDSGIPYTFFYCSFFADSFLRFVDNNVAYLFGDLPYEVFFTNSFQLAEHIHKAIRNPKAFNRKYPVQGSESMTFPEAAKRFFSIYEPNVSIQQLPLEAIGELGLPIEEAEFLHHVWEILGGFDERFISEETYEQLESRPTGISDFASQMKVS